MGFGLVFWGWPEYLGRWVGGRVDVWVGGFLVIGWVAGSGWTGGRASARVISEPLYTQQLKIKQKLIIQD